MIRRTWIQGSAKMLCLSWIITGCGAPLGKEKDEDAKEGASHEADALAEDGQLPFDLVVTPPREYYDELFANALRDLDSDEALALADSQEVLFVNFDGATITKGFQRGQSFIPCQASSTVPPSGLSPADRATVIADTQAYFAAAGTSLLVTQSEPTSGNFTTIHVGGSYGDLGCTGSSSLLGIAPLDKGNANRNDIGYVFTQAGVSLKVLAMAVAHEAGHSFGLEHVTNNQDLMLPTSGPGILGFAASPLVNSGLMQDGPAVLKQALGVSTTTPLPPPTPTSTSTSTSTSTGGGTPPTLPGLDKITGIFGKLPGLGQILALGKLLPSLKSGTALDITKLLPALQGLFGKLGGGSLPGLDKILTLISTLAGGSSTSLPLSDLSQVVSKLLGGTGSSALDLSSLAKLVGLGGLDSGSLEISLDGKTLPDLTKFLGLDSVSDLPTLISSLIGSGVAVKASFEGADRDALLSLLKVGYMQQYKQLGGKTP